MSTVSTKAIEAIVEKLRCQFLRQSTKNSYYGVWKSFNEFNIKLDSKPKSWEERLTLFVGYLISLNRQSSMIKSYISAIKAVLKYEKIELSENKVLLSSLIKACKLQNDCIQTQLPIRKGLLQVIINSVEKYYDHNPQPYLCTMFRALFLTAYFGLFRIGELTLSPHVIKARDVHIGVNKKKLLFVLHSSKTHNKSSKPQIIKIDSIKKYDVNCKNVSVMQNCPFQLLQEYISRRRKYR